MGGYVFQFGVVFDAWRELLRGAALTVQLSAAAIVLGLLVAMLGAWVKTAQGGRWLRPVVDGYIEMIRNTPFLLQLFFFFFGLPALGVRLSPNQAALLTMVVNLGAYATEILRAGIEAIPRGQIEAALSLGLRPAQVFRLIVLMPALKIVYPPLAAQFTMAMLGSSVVSAISADELTSVANLLQSVTFRAFEIYAVVTLMYLAIAFAFRGLLTGIYHVVFGRAAAAGAR
ncbi:MAG: amino acid ABC transporter permease [Alphaproteobacteria bacterium]|nr:amino acid ABC transporter permease [Alphaproteobacteria bacterium]